MTHLFIGMLLGMIIGLAIGSLSVAVKYSTYEIKRLRAYEKSPRRSEDRISCRRDYHDAHECQACPSDAWLPTDCQ